MNAMFRIPEPARRRVVSAAGLLASDKDGEVVAAARAVCRLLKPLGTTPAALIDKALSEPRPARAKVLQPGEDHRNLARICAGCGSNILNDWEAQFLESIVRQRDISEKQLNKLVQIHAKIDRAMRQ